jgi:hypothetical protein
MNPVVGWWFVVVIAGAAIHVPSCQLPITNQRNDY